jgi:hypothetical protein
VVPIEEDQEMLARRKAAIQAAAQLVIEEREKAAQLATQVSFRVKILTGSFSYRLKVVQT